MGEVQRSNDARSPVPRAVACAVHGCVRSGPSAPADDMWLWCVNAAHSTPFRRIRRPWVCVGWIRSAHGRGGGHLGVRWAGGTHVGTRVVRWERKNGGGTKERRGAFPRTIRWSERPPIVVRSMLWRDGAAAASKDAHPWLSVGGSRIRRRPSRVDPEVVCAVSGSCMGPAREIWALRHYRQKHARR